MKDFRMKDERERRVKQEVQMEQERERAKTEAMDGERR